MSAALRHDDNGRVAVSLDRLAVCVSIGCLIQCLLLPVLVIVMPFVSVGFLGQDAFHLFLLVVIIPVSTLAFLLGWNFHRNAKMFGPGLAGLAVLMLAATVGHDIPGTWGEAMVTSLGGILLISGHLLNLRSRRRACIQAAAQ